MPASASVPWSRRTRRTQSANNAHGLVNGISPVSGPDSMCKGTHQDPPAASVNGPKSHRMTNGTVPALGTRTVLPNKGAGSNKRRTRNGGTKAPALVNGDGKADERALNESSSTHPGVVQSNKQTAVENGCPFSARPKSRRWRNKLGSKTRSRCAPVPPTEDEDWEKEIQEVALLDWEKKTFGLQPYGPEDLISFALRDSSLHKMATPILPITANYRPARRHPRPVEWTCYKVPLEKGQFADVDE